MTSGTRIGLVEVKEPFRNQGGSWGLDYPFDFGELPGVGFCVWHQHTGLVVHVAGEQQGSDWQRRFWAGEEVKRESYRLNKIVDDFNPAEYDAVE